MKLLKLLLTGSLAFCATAIPTQAAIITYTDKAAFLAAINPSPNVVDFEFVSSGTFQAYDTPSFFGANGTVAQVSFPNYLLSFSGGNVFYTNNAFGTAADWDGDTNAINNGGSRGTFTINGAYTAFGMDVMSLDTVKNAVFGVSYTLADSTPQAPLQLFYANAPRAGSPPPNFFGAIGTEGELFTALILPSTAEANPVPLNNSAPFFDNVILGTAVPEPSTVALLSLGGIALFFRRRRA